MFGLKSYSRSNLLFVLVAAALVLIEEPKCLAAEKTEAEGKREGRSQGESDDTLSNEELHKLMGIWDHEAEASDIVTTIEPAVAPSGRISFPTDVYSTPPASGSYGLKTHTAADTSNNGKVKSSAELIQSLTMLNSLLGNPSDSGDVAATAAIITAAIPSKTTTTPAPAPPLKSADQTAAAHQSLALLNSLIGVGNTNAGTGSSANLAAAAAMLGLGGPMSMPSVRQADNPSAAALTNLILAQAGLGQQKNSASPYQSFQGFTKSQTDLDTASSNQLSGLLGLLETFGSVGKTTQSPLNSLLNFGQQQVPQQTPDYLSALFGQSQKQKQEEEQQAQVKHQQMNSNILLNLLTGGQHSQQQQQQNLLANLLASGSNNNPLSIFGTQTQAPSILSSLGTIGSSVFSLAGNTLSGLSGTRGNGKPRVRGVDTRVGLGYRMGPNADAQVMWEIGPQIFTEPITNEVKPVVTERPAPQFQKRFQIPQPIQASASQNVPRRASPNFRKSPHTTAPVRKLQPRQPPSTQTTDTDNTNDRPSEEDSKRDSYVMLTSYEKWLAAKDKGTRPLPSPVPLPMVRRRIFPLPPSKSVPFHRRMYHAHPPIRVNPEPQHINNGRPNKIVRVGRRPPVFPKPNHQIHFNSQRPDQEVAETSRNGNYNNQQFHSRMGFGVAPTSAVRALPPPPNYQNYNPWQNFVPEADDSFDRRNAGVVDPTIRQIEMQNERMEMMAMTPTPPTHGMGPGPNRRIISIVDWTPANQIAEAIRGGITRLKTSPVTQLFYSTSTVPPSKEEQVMIPSLHEHLLKKIPDLELEDEEPVVKVGGDLSYEELVDSLASGSSRQSMPKLRNKPKIKVEDKKTLELKPMPDHMKQGVTDRPIDPPVEMFIDIDNGEVSVRKSVASLDSYTPAPPKPKSEEELEDEESQKIFQDVQDHLKASFEEFKFREELDKATKEHKEKLKAGLDDSMGMVTRYFDLMDAKKRKRDVWATEETHLELKSENSSSVK